MVRKHHGLKGHESEQTQETMEDRGTWHAAVHGVAKESDTTQWLNKNHNQSIFFYSFLIVSFFLATDFNIGYTFEPSKFLKNHLAFIFIVFISMLAS